MSVVALKVLPPPSVAAAREAVVAVTLLLVSRKKLPARERLLAAKVAPELMLRASVRVTVAALKVLPPERVAAVSEAVVPVTRLLVVRERLPATERLVAVSRPPELMVRAFVRVSVGTLRVLPPERVVAASEAVFALTRLLVAKEELPARESGRRKRAACAE